jgi:predicted transcriptional regulator
MDARLDAMTRAKLDAFAEDFRRSRGAILREVMQWGLRRRQTGTIEQSNTQGPFQSLFLHVAPTLHMQVREVARSAGVGVAPWLRHMLREITVADFPRSWQVAAQGTGRTQASPRVSLRSHDSRDYDERFMLRLDRNTRVKLQQLTDHFGQSKAEVTRQLIAQAKPEDFPPSWQMAVHEDRADQDEGEEP